MPDKPKDSQQTEQTPTGYTVPVPKRDDFFGNLKKAAKPEPPKVKKLPARSSQHRGKGGQGRGH